MDHCQYLLNSLGYFKTWTKYFKLKMKIHLHSMVNAKSQIRLLIISQELFYWTQVTRNKFSTLPIITLSGSPAELRICYVMMFLTSSSMDQDLRPNTPKYGVWEYTSSMGVLQKISLMIYHIVVIWQYMQILQELLSTGNQTILSLSTDPIMFGLMNTIFVSPYNTITLQVIYHVNNILKVLFIIHTSSTWFHVNLILHPLHSTIQQFSHMKLSYPFLEIKLVLIYCMIKLLQSRTSLILYQINQMVINFQYRLNKIWWNKPS